MASNISELTVQDLQLQSYRERLKRHHDTTVQDMYNRHSENVLKTQENLTNQLKQLEEVYEVRISKEAEELEKKLSEVRDNKEKKLAEEEKTAQEEFSKTHIANQKKLAEYKRNADLKLADAKAEVEKQLKNLNERAAQESKRIEQKYKEKA